MERSWSLWFRQGLLKNSSVQSEARRWEVLWSSRKFINLNFSGTAGVATAHTWGVLALAHVGREVRLLGLKAQLDDVAIVCKLFLHALGTSG